MDHTPAGKTRFVLDDALRTAAAVAGDRWVLLAIGALADGPARFGDLQAALDGIAPNVLVSRLRRMEAAGLIVAAAYQKRPRRYLYALTESGSQLAAVLPALRAWASRHRDSDAQRHAVCGTPLETRVWCPTCAVTVDHGSVDESVTWV